MTSVFASLGQFARIGDLSGSEIVLNDIDPECAQLMCDWGNAGARNDGIDLTFACERDLE